MEQADHNRIEKSVTIRVPRPEVWRALTDVTEFNEWFGVRLTGPFVPGARLRGPVTHEGYTHLTMDITIEDMEPEERLSWRWHPHAVDTDIDYSSELTTLVTFTLQVAEEGTELTVVESGFNRIPESRREEAYRANDEGWTLQMKSIEQHLGAVA